jgi:hypothetical protein
MQEPILGRPQSDPATPHTLLHSAIFFSMPGKKCPHFPSYLNDDAYTTLHRERGEDGEGILQVTLPINMSGFKDE